MKNLLSNFDQARNISIHFLRTKFSGSKLTLADMEDAVSTAFEKLLLDAAKPKPSLNATTQTICYLSYHALVDVYRKRKREILIGETTVFTPLSTTAMDAFFLEKKTKIEEIIASVVYLPQRRRELIEAKYDARYFDSTATLEEMMRYKNRSKHQSLTHEMGFATEGAMRQEMFRAVSTLRTRMKYEI